MPVPTKDAIVRIGYGDLYVQLVAEGAGGNPDVMDDLCRRANNAFKEACVSVVESGIIDVDIEVDEE